MKAVGEARAPANVRMPRTPEVTGRASRLRRWLRQPAVRTALAATIGLRLALSLVALLTVTLLRDQYVRIVQDINLHGGSLGVGVFPAPLSGPGAYLVGPWLRWDANNYLNIAQHGYTFPGSTAFLPLYPLLIRILSVPLAGDVAGSSLIISTAASFAMFLLLYRLVFRLTQSDATAAWSVFVACALPISFFFMAPYTESLFCALSLGAMLAAMDRRWGMAALCGVLASLTRQQGLLLGLLAVPALGDAIEAFWRSRVPPSTRLRTLAASAWRPAAFALAPVAAYGVWVAIIVVGLRQGAPWQELTQSPLWKQTFIWPGMGVVVDLGHIVLQPSDVIAHYPDIILDAAAALAAAVCIGLAWRRIPPGLLLYCLAGWCLAVVKVQTIDVTTGTARYLLVLLPLCLVPGEWLARAKLPVRCVFAVAATLVACAIVNKWVLWTWIN